MIQYKGIFFREKIMVAIGTAGGPAVAETLEAQEAQRQEQEAAEKMQKLQEKFDTEYRSDIEALFPSDTAPGVASDIAGNYAGDISQSVEKAVDKLSLTQEQKKELTQNTLSYLDAELSSDFIIDTLRSDEGLTVVEGMELGYIGALTEYDNTLDLSTLADSIKPGDIIKVADGAITINGEQTGKVQSGFEDENVREVKDFTENPYFPILTAHVENNSITPQQLTEIQENFVTTQNISSSIHQVLGTDHIVLSVIEEFDTSENVETRKKNMFSDFPECEDSKGELLTQLLSENYVRILDKTGKPDTQSSLLMAFQVAANKIVDGKKTFKRTEAFTRAYDRIKEGKGTSDTMAHDLKLMHTTVNKSEGIVGKKTELRNARMGKKAEQKALLLQAKFDDIQELLAVSSTNDKVAKKELLRKAEEALAAEQAEDKVSGGEATSLGGGSELDALEDAIKQNP